MSFFLRCRRFLMRCLTWSSNIFYWCMPFLGVTQSVFCSGKVRSQYSSPLSVQKTDNIWHPPIEVIDEKSVKLMQLVYGESTMSLGDQRYSAYREQIMQGTLRPRSSGAAAQHGRRVFTQLREWVPLGVSLTIRPYISYGLALLRKLATSLFIRLTPLHHLSF